MNQRLKDEYFAEREVKEVVSERERVCVYGRERKKETMRLTRRVIISCESGLLRLLLCLKIQARLIGGKIKFDCR